MATGYIIKKLKDGDLILIGGMDEDKPETIEIEKETIRDFIEGFLEYLTADELVNLLDEVERVIDEKLCDEETK